MFNSKKIKELEEDVRTLWTLVQRQQEKIDGNEAFKSFCTNREEQDRCRMMNNQLGQTPLMPLTGVGVPDAKWESVSTKAVLALVLKKMGLKMRYEPGKEEVIHSTPSEFKLVKRSGFDV